MHSKTLVSISKSISKSAKRLLQNSNRSFRFSWRKATLYGVALTFLIAAPLYALQSPHRDSLTLLPWWNAQVNLQASQNKGHSYTSCLFGDSISSGLGQTLGEGNINFAMGGLSTVSLLAQLKILKTTQVTCQSAIVAIGTNDAMYTIEDAEFTENLQESLNLIKSLGAQQITLVPAFYSTVKASLNPMAAGPLSRVNEINQLIYQVALSDNLPVVFSGLENLYENNSLRSDMTIDGVHLNDQGKDIYRSFLIKLMS